VDGRNVWKTDLRAAAERVRTLAERTGATVWLANAAPLMHLPVTVEPEGALDPALKERVAFAKERLQELRLLTHAADRERDGRHTRVERLHARH
jgi:5-methyltetrahydropteroyltriglutamate--homocysteine methyltransferase